MTAPGAWLIAPLLAFYLLGAAGAVTPSVAAVVVAVAGLHLFEVAVARLTDPALTQLLNRVQAGTGNRGLLRLLLMVILVVRQGGLTALHAGLIVGCVFLYQGARMLQALLVSLISTRRRRRAETRNIDVPGAELPPGPPDALLRHERSLRWTDLLLLVALGWQLWTGSTRLLLPGAALTAAAALALSAALLPYLWRLRSRGRGADQYEETVAEVRRLEPQVVMYFSGGVRDTYQVNTWLATLEQLDRPVLVLLRERAVFESLAPTTLPVLCLPKAADVLNLMLTSARVALYASNVGKNIHLLREPDVMSVFIGHGDSDKTASFNPFTKVYDEVWVAGEAGRDRYLHADIGVRDEQVVIVGRPQLDSLQHAARHPGDGRFTVLYAPTWEGWTDDPNHSSIVTMGVAIVRTLLATEGVRVLFKPHPRTGSVDPAAGLARDQIAELLSDPLSTHEAVLADERSLYDCFDQADALVSDVSSVVSDFLASEKPYFVANGADLPAAEFRERYASAGGAYLVGPGADGLAAGLADARSADSMALERRQVRTYLLGPADVPSLARFQAAVGSLCARARRGHAHPSSPDRGSAPGEPQDS